MERRSGEDVDVTDFPTPDEVTIQRDAVSKSRFEYDRVFAPGSEQFQVFESVQPVCISVLDGYNVCIFAYGQTGMRHLVYIFIDAFRLMTESVQ